MWKWSLWTYHIICTVTLSRYHNRNTFQNRAWKWGAPGFLCQCSEVIFSLFERHSKLFLCLQPLEDCSCVHVRCGSHTFSHPCYCLKCLFVFSAVYGQSQILTYFPQLPHVYFCSCFANLILNSTVAAGSQTHFGFCSFPAHLPHFYASVSCTWCMIYLHWDTWLKACFSFHCLSFSPVATSDVTSQAELRFLSLLTFSPVPTLVISLCICLTYFPILWFEIFNYYIINITIDI